MKTHTKALSDEKSQWMMYNMFPEWNNLLGRPQQKVTISSLRSEKLTVRKEGFKQIGNL